MIWIIGGTNEARRIVDKISYRDDFIVTCATSSESEFIYRNLLVKRMHYHEMISFIKEKNIDLVVDLSHPYAVLVSKNAKKACRDLKVKYVRYVREKTKLNNEVEYFNSIQDFMDKLSKIKGTVFFTTGSKNIKDFEALKGNNRFVYRVLPYKESIEQCRKNGVKMKNIVGILGPFSKDFNKEMFKEYASDYVVMKDSGDSGGTLSKIRACKSLKIKAFVIGRDKEIGINNLDYIEKLIKNWRSEK